MHEKTRVVTLLAAMFLFAACTGGQEASDSTDSTDESGLTEVRFVYDFFPSGNHTVLWATLVEGFFEEEGLDVTIEMVSPNTGVQTLVANQAEFAFADFTTMALAVQEQGAEVLAVMGLAQQTPMAILSPAENEIVTPEDLRGKTVVDFTASNTQIVWPFFLEANGLSSEDVDLRLVDPAARLSLVTQGRVDATVGFFSDNEPVLRELCQCAVNIIRWKDYGIPLFSNGIVANRGYVEQNPEVVEAFTRALAKGLDFVRADPEAGVDDLLESTGDEIELPRDAVLAQTQHWLTLTTTPSGGGTPIGFMTEEDWQAEIDMLVQAGVITEPDDIQKFYTNEFVPQEP